jgi:hypothetical protein
MIRQNEPETYIRMLLRIFEFSSIIYGEDIEQMEAICLDVMLLWSPKKGNYILENYF